MAGIFKMIFLGILKSADKTGFPTQLCLYVCMYVCMYVQTSQLESNPGREKASVMQH